MSIVVAEDFQFCSKGPLNDPFVRPLRSFSASSALKSNDGC